MAKVKGSLRALWSVVAICEPFWEIIYVFEKLLVDNYTQIATKVDLRWAPKIRHIFF